MSTAWHNILKRTIDTLISIILLCLSWPGLALISLLVKISSPGPALYKQKRYGKNGRIFWMYKFRTMPDGIEKGIGPVWGKENDSRSTPIGLYLRVLHLDELPQLINVLKGDMSIVGPRPERPYFVNQFKKTIPNYEFRHTVKPGVTGWAQINGYRGNTSVRKRLEYDIFYIENRSLIFDLKILLITPFAIKIKDILNKERFFHLTLSQRDRCFINKPLNVPSRKA